MKKVSGHQRPSDATADLAGMSDEDLLERYRTQGEKGAFDELVHRYERELFNYLRRYLGDSGMAEDAFQATFLQVHLKCDRFEEGRKFRPWLYTIATNQAIDAQRRNRRHKSVSLDRNSKSESAGDVRTLMDLLVSKEPPPESRLDSTQQRDWIRDALEQLPDPLREAVNLVYYQGLKYREAADILEIPVGTVKSRLHAAILKLSEAYESHTNTNAAS